jgi:hypothetical protein
MKRVQSTQIFVGAKPNNTNRAKVQSTQIFVGAKPYNANQEKVQSTVIIYLFVFSQFRFDSCSDSSFSKAVIFRAETG